MAISGRAAKDLRLVVAALLMSGCSPGVGGDQVTLATGVEVSEVRPCGDPRPGDQQKVAINNVPGGYHITVSAFRNEHTLPNAYLSEGSSDEMKTLVLTSPKQTGSPNKMECFGVLRVAVTDRLKPRQNLYVTYDGVVIGEVGVPARPLEQP